MSKHRRTALMIIGSIVLAVAPKCPFCFLAYVGIFGVASTSAYMYRAWLLPFTVIWLVFTVGVLAVQPGGKRRHGPVFLGVVAGLAVYAGKFVVNDQVLVLSGLAAFVGAAVWRSWLLRLTSSEFCSPCEQLPLLNNKESGLKSRKELPTFGGH